MAAVAGEAVASADETGGLFAGVGGFAGLFGSVGTGGAGVGNTDGATGLAGGNVTCRINTGLAGGAPPIVPKTDGMPRRDTGPLALGDGWRTSGLPRAGTAPRAPLPVAVPVLGGPPSGALTGAGSPGTSGGGAATGAFEPAATTAFPDFLAGFFGCGWGRASFTANGLRLTC